MRYSLILIICSLFISNLSFAQVDEDWLLAEEYFQKEEYDKAVILYDKLFQDPSLSESVYPHYFASLLAVKDYKKTEKTIKKMIKSYPARMVYRVDMGILFATQGNEAKADKEFEGAISGLGPDKAEISLLANAFLTLKKYDLAITTLEKGNRLYGVRGMFNLEMADVYNSQGDHVMMIEKYLDFLNFNPSSLQLIKNELSINVTKKKEYLELETQLYKRIQKSPDYPVYPELLIWHFIQRRDFESAFIQVKALDKRYKETGSRVMDLARTAYSELEYDAAILAFQYVIDKGRNNSLYITAKKEQLKTKKDKVTLTTSYTNEDLTGLESDYYAFLEEFGKNNLTVNTMRQLAQLQALYLDKIDTAIKILEHVLNMGGVKSALQANCKLDLGDYYIILGEIWEATLLYSQVDKKFKDDPLGELARFKNAKLSYFKGEFEWSQAQLKVLKASTSELIANDALDLSIFILDNLGLDSTVYPMKLYAKSELLLFQNKFEEAMTTLDSITEFFPDHALTDDIDYAKAQIYYKKGKYETAASYLTNVVEKYPKEILADNALYLLADINERHLKNPDKARELIEKLIFEYKGSLFVVEARKRYRKLRGDNIN